MSALRVLGRAAVSTRLAPVALFALAIAGCVLPDYQKVKSRVAGTGGDGGTGGAPGVTTMYINVAPSRLLDLVFMIDNSTGMPPKVAKMNAQFPKLIAALKHPYDGTLPDLRIAIIDSDLGTGAAYSTGSCAPKPLSDGTISNFGDLGRFQMLNYPAACTFNAGSLYLEYKSGHPLNFTGDINTVFACLAGNLGELGCGEEHQLQAFEFAIAARGIGNETQQQMLRGDAVLGLVFLTDEDDCSAATNDRLFGDKTDLHGESASLRCATRAHKCGGINFLSANYPTTTAYEHPFADCQARMGDECSGSVDTSVPTSCNPLKSVATLADEIKNLKADPSGQIVVAGIFGWPLSEADMAAAKYKIAPIPNPNPSDTSHPTLYDYWPVCYDPNHMPSASSMDPATGFDPTAAGWGAAGGLRESAYIDEFGANGLKFSICQSDFSQSMKAIGDTLARKLPNPCLDAKLQDTNLTTPGLQPDCRVVWKIPSIDPKDSTQLVYTDGTTPLAQCPAGATNGGVTADCWQLWQDATKCPISGQLVTALRTAQEIASAPQLAPGTQLSLQCRTCDTTSTLDPSSATYQACNY
jgi:hypothetical protein